ncbi:MAG: DUF4184 family protein, partial [Chthoniobacterales bacterium]
MPFTFSHPAAVLPFKRLTPRYLNFAALVIGSTTPDMGYFLHDLRYRHEAHTFGGSFLVDLPFGLLMLAVFYLCRGPVCYLLPFAHRRILFPLTQQKLHRTPLRFLVACLSILIGTWTHIIWDSFTHPWGYFTRLFPVFNKTFLIIDHVAFPGYFVLQLASSIVGGVIVAMAYWFWFRKHRAPSSPPQQSDLWRYLLWIVLLVAPVFFSLPRGLHIARIFDGYFALHVF